MCVRVVCLCAGALVCLHRGFPNTGPRTENILIFWSQSSKQPERKCIVYRIQNADDGIVPKQSFFFLSAAVYPVIVSADFCTSSKS